MSPDQMLEMLDYGRSYTFSDLGAVWDCAYSTATKRAKRLCDLGLLTRTRVPRADGGPGPWRHIFRRSGDVRPRRTPATIPPVSTWPRAPHEALRHVVRGLELSEEQLARKAGITRGGVSHVLSGRRTSMSIAVLRICVALGMDDSEIGAIARRYNREGYKNG